MDNDNFTPPSPDVPQSPPSSHRDPYAEPPVKDFSHLVTGRPNAALARHRVRQLLVSLFVVIIIGGGVAGAYWQFIRAKPPLPTKPVTSNAKSVAAKLAAAPMVSYTSTGFGLSLQYPKTWTLSDGGTTSLSVISPVMQITDENGKLVLGKIIMLVQPQGAIPSDFGTGNAVAVRDSQLLKYSNPSASQLAQTYLSFIQYDSATISGTLNAIYITGNYGYQKDQIIQRADIATLNPLVTITFGQCATAACSNVGDLSIQANDWNNSALSTPIFTILKSLSFS